MEALEEAVSQMDISIAGNELVKARLAFVSTIGYRIKMM